MISMSKAQSAHYQRTGDQPTRRRTIYQGLMLTLLAGLAMACAIYWTTQVANSPTPQEPARPLLQLTLAVTAPPISNTTTFTNFIPLVVVHPDGSTPTAAVPITPTTSPTLQPTNTPTPTVPNYTYEVVNVYPHDPQAFTQGLVFDGDVLYEGTGLNGRSSLRRVDLASGSVLQQVDLSSNYFGEGVTVVGDRIVQLTWTSNIGFVYDKNSFALLQEFSYPTQGWGVTYDGERLIMSDGSARLYFWDPATLAQLGSVEVRDPAGPVVSLNELEYIEGEVYANIWQTDRIARINPNNGQVTGWIDLAGLLTPQERAASDVLNGIAYMPDSKRLFVTGKLWPKLFEIKLLMIQ